MAINGVASSGLMSGLNVNELVASIIKIEERPLNLLNTKRQDYELKIASVLKLSSKLSAYKTSLEALNNADKFNTKTASVSKTSGGTELLTVSATSAATDGSYSVTVNQIAKANRKASQGWIDQNSTAIASGTGSFSFRVGSSGSVTTVGVTDSTTLQGLRDKINTANVGVKASIVDDGTGSNKYRLNLAAENTGLSNNITITQNDTNLDFTNKKVEAAYAYTSNTYAGTVASNEGNNYTGTTNKTFLLQAVTAGTSGTATYKYSVDGGINWLGYGGAAYNSAAGDDTSGGAITTSTSLKAIDGSAAANEGVTASFSSGSSLASGDKFSIDVFNPEMQAAQDAVISLDNATIVKSSNTITDAIQGITMKLLQSDASSTLTISVSSSTTTAKADIGDFVKSYNDLFKYIDEQLSYDPDIAKANPLLGDPTLLEIRRRITDKVTGAIQGLSKSSYTNLSQIGIKSDSKTGQLSLDSSVLNNALNTKPEAVSKLFVGTATSTDAAISFVSKTLKTQAGKYSVSISAAAEQASLTTDNDLSTTGLGSNESLIFKYSKNYTKSDATTTAFTVTLNSGDTINTIVNSLNSAFATQKIGMTALNNSGKLQIKTDDYGADIWFQVTTDQGHATDQLWDTSGLRNDAGVNIAGSINNHVAEGEGNVLTGTAGFPEEGLKISSTSNQAGLFGTVAVSLGITDLLPAILDSYTNSTTGVLKSKESTMQSSIDGIAEQMTRLDSKIADKEKRLHAEFSRLEVALSKYDSLSQYLTNALTAIPTIGK